MHVILQNYQNNLHKFFSDIHGKLTANSAVVVMCQAFVLTALTRYNTIKKASELTNPTPDSFFAFQ
jgi:hypothetical protein